MWFPQLLSTSTSQRSNYCPLSRRRGLSVHVLCLENIHKHGKEAKPTTRTLEYNSVICAIKWMTLSVMMSTWLPLIDSTRVIYILPSTNLLTYFFHHNFRCGCWNWHWAFFQNTSRFFGPFIVSMIFHSNNNVDAFTMRYELNMVVLFSFI